MDSAALARTPSAAGLWRSAARSRAAAALLLATFFWMVAAAASSGFLGKWGLRDGAPRFSIERLLDGSGYRPFVYRQLVPMLANTLDRAMPNTLKRDIADHLSPEQVFIKTPWLFDPDLRFRYVVVCYASFLALFGSLFVLRRIVLDAGAGRLAALVAPASLVLALPYLQTRGGYFYDCVELFFLALAFLLAERGRGLWLILLAAPAALNKESFFFFVPTLFPLLRARLPGARAAGTIAAAMFVAGLVALAVEREFSGAPGGAAEWHLLSNLPMFLAPHFYRETELTYGLIGPSGFSLAALLVILIVALRATPFAAPLRRHLALAAAINVPLFVVFSIAGELRNLSLLFVGFTILLARGLDVGSGTEEAKP